MKLSQELWATAHGRGFRRLAREAAQGGVSGVRGLAISRLQRAPEDWEVHLLPILAELDAEYDRPLGASLARELEHYEDEEADAVRPFYLLGQALHRVACERWGAGTEAAANRHRAGFTRLKDGWVQKIRPGMGLVDWARAARLHGQSLPFEGMARFVQREQRALLYTGTAFFSLKAGWSKG